MGSERTYACIKGIGIAPAALITGLRQVLVGGPEPFERFLKAYIQAKRFSVHTSAEMRAFFCDFFRDVPAVQQVDWDTWLHAPGLPIAENTYDTSHGQVAFELAERWHAHDGDSHSSGMHIQRKDFIHIVCSVLAPQGRISTPVDSPVWFL